MQVYRLSGFFNANTNEITFTVTSGKIGRE